MNTIRALIADDHPSIRDGLQALFPSFGIEIVTKEMLGSDALESYDPNLHDVVVLDINFGEGKLSGLDVSKQLLERHPKVSIVLYSQHDQIELIKESYQIGIKSFIPKSASPTQLADAMKKAALGQVYLLPEISERLAMLWTGGESPLQQLDPRELEVFKQMAAGRMNQEIADSMGLSVKTISTTSQNIKDKLHMTRPAELTLLAVKHGLIMV